MAKLKSTQATEERTTQRVCSRGYQVTPAGQVVVKVDTLLKSPAVQRVAKLAREIVRISEGN